MLKTFANWPPDAGHPPRSWQGLRLAGDLKELRLPQAVLRQVNQVTKSLEKDALALWLCGSASRGRLRKNSDIDWLLVPRLDYKSPPDGWPTPRHSFHVFTREQFLDGLKRGREFMVWQLAYGQALILDPSIVQDIQSTVLPGRLAAVRSKETLLRRRRELIAVRLRAGDFDTARKELLELIHQEGRLRLLSAGIIPGCRSEVDIQMEAAIPTQAKDWKSFASRQRQALATTTSSRAILQGAREAGIPYSA